MKQLYDLTFTIAMTRKQADRLMDAGFAVEDDGRLQPEWLAGKAAVRELMKRYGVKAKLKQFTFGRNRDDVQREGR